MKSRKMLLFFFVILIFTISSCTMYGLPYVNGLDRTEINGVHCYDYTKYHDEDALLDISFDNITDYIMLDRNGSLAGYKWYYVNEDGFKILVEYDTNNPKCIKNAYFDGYEKLPLIKDGVRYMNVYQYIKLHDYIFDYDITNKDCIEYNRIRDFSEVDATFFNKFGISSDKVSKIINFSKYIPLSEINSMEAANAKYTKFKISFKRTERLFTDVAPGYKYYYLEFNDNGTIDFYANADEIIIDDDIINENHYYIEQVNVIYINRIFINILEKHTGEDINDSDFSTKYKFTKGKEYITFKREYLASESNKIETYMNVVFNSDDTIKVLDVFYGENNIYHED